MAGKAGGTGRGPAPTPLRDGAADKWIPKLSETWPGIDHRASGVAMPRMLLRVNELLEAGKPLKPLQLAAQDRAASDGTDAWLFWRPEDPERKAAQGAAERGRTR